ncbi:hypothetical protein SAMN05421770_10626 [Granulicella rosea]|uniref:Uncharacterized protein n=1 Tax=Granulicella rosea TaxID=474952 RepID=A0A239L0H1_9BACT|nr:hypothetical protein [Granulicella rosea]SNT24087.1 hypothetical protein SAMN05421770_10626 [Granulicella rosea]
MFADGEDFDCVFDTDVGPVRVFAETHVLGSHLVLDEFLFFPESDQDRLVLGVRQTLEILRLIRVQAKEAGFEALTVSYHRVGKKRRGNIIVLTRSL